MDFIIITFTSSRSILPASSIGSTVHHPEYVANPIFELSSINPPQIYVRTIMWMKLPTMWKKKMRRIEIGTFACVHNSSKFEILLNVFLIFEFLISREKLKLIKTSLCPYVPEISRTCRSTLASWTPQHGRRSATCRRTRACRRIRSTIDGVVCTLSTPRNTCSRNWFYPPARRLSTTASIVCAAVCETGRPRACSTRTRSCRCTCKLYRFAAL